MHASKKACCLAAVLLALTMLLACLSWLPMGGGNGMPAVAETGAEPAAAENASPEAKADAADASVPTAVASYDFTSTSFDGTGWSYLAGPNATAVPTVTEGTGLYLKGGYQGEGTAGAALSYGRANPLKGQVKDGFSVIVYLYTGANMIDEYTGIFGFTKDSSGALSNGINNFFFVASDGVSLRLNNIGTSGDGNDFYDIIGGSNGHADLDMTDLSQYILTVSGTSIRIYLDGSEIAEYTWTENGAAGTYRINTLDFVNNADWFMFGRANNIWGNPDITVEQTAFYASALTAEEIAAINASYADFSELNPLVEQGEAIRANNYDLSTSEGAAAYADFDRAFASARALSFLTATQKQVDDAAAALQTALNGLQAHYRDPDLTDGLAAAYPLTENGRDLTDAANAENRVLYMNGEETSELEAASFVRRQGRAAAKLFTDDMLNRGEMTTDPDAPSSTGLKIPSAAFAGVTADTGMTLTVSVLAESWSAEYQWSRILQLGTKNPNGDGASGAQFFYALQSIYTRANITTPGTGGLNWVADNVGIPTLGEWITVSLSFEPNQHTIYLYVSSFSTSQWSGGTAMTEYTVSAAEYETIITAILNGQDNWIGRSYWATDDNLIGYASNLSVYGRALTTDEVTQLHAAKDLSAFVE